MKPRYIPFPHLSAAFNFAKAERKKKWRKRMINLRVNFFGRFYILTKEQFPNVDLGSNWFNPRWNNFISSLQFPSGRDDRHE